MTRAAAVLLALPLACAPHHDRDALTMDDIVDTRGLVGTWRWELTTTVDGVERQEHEEWEFTADVPWPNLSGRYRREVGLRALDRVPFTCAQTDHYQLSSTVAFAATPAPQGVQIVETSYATTPSPCDRGLRRLGRLHGVRLGPDRIELGWGDGVQVLERSRPAVAPPPPGHVEAPSGPWTWEATSWTAGALVQQERERWELTVGDDGAVAGFYLRTVRVRDPRGQPIACAGGPDYQFVDRYLVRGAKDASGELHLREIAVDAGAHRCIEANPTRALDEARAELIGDHLVLTWRGARRQVLARPRA